MIRSDENKLVLPFPISLPREYGVLSLDAVGMPFSLRIHDDDRVVLRTEAEWIGMSASAVARWCIVYGAQQLAFVRTGHAPVVRP